MARRASRIVCAEDFTRDIEDGGEDGYFVSSKWLLSLEEYETESLMSVLRRAGYSGTYQTPTTTLFARIQKDVQYGITDNDAPGTSTNTDVRPGDSEGVLSPKYGDDLRLEIAAGETLKNIDLSADVAYISKSQRFSLQSASSKDYLDSVLAIPSEAENTPGNMLQQSENAPHNQYEAPTLIWTETLLRHFLHACELSGGASNAIAHEIWVRMSEDGIETPLDAVESCLLAYKSILWWIEQSVYDSGVKQGKNLATMEPSRYSREYEHISRAGPLLKIFIDEQRKASTGKENEQVLERHQLRIQQLRDEQQQVEEQLKAHEQRVRQSEFLIEGQTQVNHQLGEQLYRQAMGKHLQAMQDLVQQEFQFEMRRGERPQDQQVKDVTEDRNEDDSAVLVSKTRSPELREQFISDFTVSPIGNACVGDEVGEKILRVIGKEQGASSKSFEPPPQRIEEDVGDDQGPTWKSFKAALQSKIPQSFCVSTQWLSNFKDLEEEALKAGYEKVCQTGTTTWYQKGRDRHVKNLAGGACEDGSHRLSSRNDAGNARGNGVPDGGVNEVGRSKSGYRIVFGHSGQSQSVDNTDHCYNVDDEHKTSSFGVANELKKRL